MLSKYSGMSDQEKWLLYHDMCDQWVEENQPFDEQAFHRYVSKITKEMGL